MAAAVIRNMNHGQNLHVLPNNCVIVSQTNPPSPQSPIMMHSHQNMHSYQHSYNAQMQSHQTQMQQQTMHSQNQQIQSQSPHHRLGKRLIAPAPANRSLTEQNRNTPNKKPKLAYTHMPFGPSQPASVQRRNARERNRVKQVNNGFANLRQHIPSDVITALSSGGRGASKKLSKVDTLRLAVEYIRRLQDMLDENIDADSSSSSSSRLSQGSTGSYYSSSPMQTNSIPPPPCSESSASPTPSYTSDNSSVANVTYTTPVPYKYEGFDPYNPEDEELLDCITWWQQQ